MCIKMNETVNKFLLAGDKFTPETHLEQQPNFIYSTCGTFTRNREIIEKFMQTGSTDFIYKKKVDKACFQHDGYQRELAPIAYKFFDKKSSESNVAALLVKKLLPNQMINLQMNFIGRSLNNLREQKLIHLMETIFGV